MSVPPLLPVASLFGRYIVACLVLSLGLFVPAMAKAVSMAELTTVRVVVADESDAERYRASYLAMAEVLLRLSGQQQVLQDEALKPLLDKSSSYLLQYSYQTLAYDEDSAIFHDYPLPEHEELETAPVESGKRSVLTLRFDHSPLLKALQDAGLPVWGVQRPEVMMWLAVQKDGQRYILSESDEGRTLKTLHYYAAKRGVPIRFPLVDLQDQSRVSVIDVWGAYAEPVAKASQRYQRDTWVMGKSYREADRWYAQWQVNVLGKRRSFTSSSEDFFALHKAIMTNVAELLAQEYAVVSGAGQSRFTLRVMDINTLEDFDALKKYLQGLFVVELLELSRIKGSEVSYTVTLKEDFEKFSKLLELDRRLAPVVFEQQVPTQQVSQRESLASVQAAKPGDTGQASVSGHNVNPAQGMPQANTFDPLELEAPVIYYQWLRQ